MIKVFITAMAFCIACVITNAQEKKKAWETIGIDSVQFEYAYGTEFEYYWQRDIQLRSSSKALTVFVGAKYFYLNQLSMYLQYNGYTAEDSKTDDFIFSKNGVYGKGQAKNMVIKPFLDNNGRIKKVVITGLADDLFHLFIYYWENSEISLNLLKSKKAIYQDFSSDRISLTWPGVNPVITITSNPNLKYFADKASLK